MGLVNKKIGLSRDSTGMQKKKQLVKEINRNRNQMLGQHSPLRFYTGTRWPKILREEYIWFLYSSSLHHHHHQQNTGTYSTTMMKNSSLHIKIPGRDNKSKTET